MESQVQPILGEEKVDNNDENVNDTDNVNEDNDDGGNNGDTGDERVEVVVVYNTNPAITLASLDEARRIQEAGDALDRAWGRVHCTIESLLGEETSLQTESSGNDEENNNQDPDNILSTISDTDWSREEGDYVLPNAPAASAFPDNDENKEEGEEKEEDCCILPTFDLDEQQQQQHALLQERVRRQQQRRQHHHPQPSLLVSAAENVSPPHNEEGPAYEEMRAMLRAALGVAKSMQFTCYACCQVMIDPVELPCHHQICRQCLVNTITHVPLLGISEDRVATLDTTADCENQPLMWLLCDPLECGTCRASFEWWRDSVATNHGGVVVARARLYEFLHKHNDDDDNQNSMSEHLPLFAGFTDPHKTNVYLRCANPACSVVLPETSAMQHARTCRAFRCPCPFHDCPLTFDMDFSDGCSDASFAHMSSKVQSLLIRETYKHAWIKHVKTECKHIIRCCLDKCDSHNTPTTACEESKVEAGRRLFISDELEHFHNVHAAPRLKRCAELFACSDRMLTSHSLDAIDRMLEDIITTMIPRHSEPIILDGIVEDDTMTHRHSPVVDSPGDSTTTPLTLPMSSYFDDDDGTEQGGVTVATPTSALNSLQLSRFLLLQQSSFLTPSPSSLDGDDIAVTAESSDSDFIGTPPDTARARLRYRRRRNRDRRAAISGQHTSRAEEVSEF